MKPASVLVVEDDSEIRGALEDALRFEGYDVTLAKNGVEALGALPQLARPALLLLDLMMPALDGERFLEILERMPDRADFAVVVISASSYAGAMESRPGVARVLKKPFELEELLEVVRAPLGRRA